MEKQIAHLEDQQTVLTEGYQWQLLLNSKGIKWWRAISFTIHWGEFRAI